MSCAHQSLPVGDSLPEPTAAVARLRRGRQHPAGLSVVCLAVLGERFAAYILASSVVLMLGDRYGYSRAEALRLAALVNAASYLGTLPCGFLGDKLLGCQRMLRLGSAFLAVGYVALTFSSPVALFLALPLLITGNALFKPSTQVLIARLYPQGDPRLEAAQTWFYLAVNAGAALGALAAGLVVQYGGWSAAFALAAAAVVTSRRLLASRLDALPARPSAPPAERARPASSVTMRSPQRVATMFALTLAMLLYTIGYGQVEGSLLLWARDNTDRNLSGFEVPASWFVALPALLVLVLGPAQLALIGPLQRRIGSQRLVAAGLLAVMLAFVVLMPAAGSADPQLAGPGWLVACLVLLAIGELLVAPLGLALLMRRAPPRFLGGIVAVWHIFGALGFWLAGEIGTLWTCWTPLQVLALLAALPFAGAVLLWVSSPRWVERIGTE